VKTVNKLQNKYRVLDENEFKKSGAPIPLNSIRIPLFPPLSLSLPFLFPNPSFPSLSPFPSLPSP